MKTTIDKAGRVVIPAQIRSQMGLKAGMELEVEVRDFSIRLGRAVPGPKIVRRSNRLVARPTAGARQQTSIDVSSVIRDERDRWPW
jgi:AbrB family looped-hinge helix DNA binding protein